MATTSGYIDYATTLYTKKMQKKEQIYKVVGKDKPPHS